MPELSDLGAVANLGLNGKGRSFLSPSSVKTDDIALILKDGYDIKLVNDGFHQLVRST